MDGRKGKDEWSTDHTFDFIGNISCYFCIGRLPYVPSAKNRKENDDKKIGTISDTYPEITFLVAAVVAF